MTNRPLPYRPLQRQGDRRAWAVRAFWGGMLLLFAVMLARQFEWFPIDLDESGAAKIVETPGGELVEDFPDSGNLPPQQEPPVATDPVVLSGQYEPDTADSRFGNHQPLRRPTGEIRTIEVSKWEEPGRSAIPERMPVPTHARPAPLPAAAVPGAAQPIPMQTDQIRGAIQADHAGAIRQVDFSGRPLPRENGGDYTEGDLRPATVTAERYSGVIPVAGTAAGTDRNGSTGSPGPAAAGNNMPPELQETLVSIDRWIEEGQDLLAHRELSRIYWKQPELREQLASRLAVTARRIYFSPQPHYMPAYEVQPGDVLSSIAAKYHVPWEYLAKLNRVEPRKIQAGQRLKVIKGPFSAAVDLSEFSLTIHSHGYYVHRYPIGVGKDHSTPVGTFKVLNRLENPTYYGPNGNVIDADDPANPLGEHWIDLGDSYGIHGTIEPESIGRAMSQGCVRMHNRHVAEVFQLLSTESEVVIRR
ncbi:MAG: L,D-transpeptidase family protein [Planctomycetaceae bacterium]|nr:L,D-transpeptidase family protein [Planctomycetaceae bacterium]